MEREKRMVGVGCFAGERTVARALRRAVERYILGAWDGAPSATRPASEGARLLGRLLTGGAAGGSEAPLERLNGFHLACRGRRLHLCLYLGGGRLTRRSFSVDELADLRRSRLH